MLIRILKTIPDVDDPSAPPLARKGDVLEAHAGPLEPWPDLLSARAAGGVLFPVEAGEYEVVG